MIERLRALLGRVPANRDADDARIRREGYPGRGTVLGVEPTGRTRRDRREVDLTLEVYLGRSRTFRVTIHPWVTPAELDRLRLGAAVPVAADHDEPGHVVLMLDAFEVDPAAIAALGPFGAGRGGARPGDEEPGSGPSGRAGR
jgi:hypothetical protein